VFLGARWLRSPLGDKPTALQTTLGTKAQISPSRLAIGTHVIIKEGGLPPAIEKKGRDGRWTRRRNPRKRCLKVRGRDCGPIAARLSRYRYGLAAPESTADRVILGKRRHLSSRPAKLRDFSDMHAWMEVATMEVHWTCHWEYSGVLCGRKRESDLAPHLLTAPPVLKPTVPVDHRRDGSAESGTLIIVRAWTESSFC
jgi:hypothetical protein